MKGILMILLFMFGAYAMNVDHWLFKTISFLWYAFVGFILTINIATFSKHSLDKLIKRIKAEGVKINMRNNLIHVIIKWTLAFFLGHIYLAPFAFLIEFISLYRIMIHLPKKYHKL